MKQKKLFMRDKKRLLLKMKNIPQTWRNCYLATNKQSRNRSGAKKYYISNTLGTSSFFDPSLESSSSSTGLFSSEDSDESCVFSSSWSGVASVDSSLGVSTSSFFPSDSVVVSSSVFSLSSGVVSVVSFFSKNVMR